MAPSAAGMPPVVSAAGFARCSPYEMLIDAEESRPNGAERSRAVSCELRRPAYPVLKREHARSEIDEFNRSSSVTRLRTEPQGPASQQRGPSPTEPPGG